MSFLANFNKMVDFLKAQGMFINHLWINPPASEAEILEVENALGYHLDKSIKDFFRECNGVQLLWSHPNNENFAKMREIIKSKNFIGYGITDNFLFDGALFIEPIKSVFLTDWYDRIYFDFTIEDKRAVQFAEKTYIEPDFSKRIKPFDMYSVFNEQTFFLNGLPNPPVVMGDDYQACYTDSFLMNFTDYLEFVLHFYASVEARRAFFSKFNGNNSSKKAKADFLKFPVIDLTKYENNSVVLPFDKSFWS